MTPLRRIGLAMAATALASLAALSIWHGGSAALADANALHARWVVGEWRDGRGPAFTPELWLQTRDDLRQALQMTPGNAQLFDDLGFLHAARARGMGQPEPESAAWVYQQSLLGDAIASYRAASTLRPTFPYSWAYLALAKHLKGEQNSEFWHAFDKALQYGHNEAGVQPALAQIAFAQWPALSADRQRLIDRMVATAAPAAHKQLLQMATQNGVALSLPPP